MSIILRKLKKLKIAYNFSDKVNNYQYMHLDIPKFETSSSNAFMNSDGREAASKRSKKQVGSGGGDGVGVLEVESKRGGGCNFLVLYIFFGFELYSSSCLMLSLIFLKCIEKLLLFFSGLYFFHLDYLQSNCHRSVFF